MLGGAFCFAAMGATTHALGPRCDWLVVALVRALIMFASTALMARAAGVRLVVFRPPTLWMRSLAGSFSLVGNFFALTRLPVADAITLSNTYPALDLPRHGVRCCASRRRRPRSWAWSAASSAWC